MNAYDWRERAACRDRDPRMWDTPAPSSGRDRVDLRVAYEAIATCRNACPVLADCDRDREPNPVGVIVAGRAYDAEGAQVPDCHRCRRPVLGRQRNARFCGPGCANAHYNAAKTQPSRDELRLAVALLALLAGQAAQRDPTNRKETA